MHGNITAMRTRGDADAAFGSPTVPQIARRTGSGAASLASFLLIVVAPVLFWVATAQGIATILAAPLTIHACGALALAIGAVLTMIWGAVSTAR